MFVREKSVFKPWVIDTPKIYDKMISFDRNYWKISKIIKDEADLARTINCLRENISYLKDVFLQLSMTNYPFVS